MSSPRTVSFYIPSLDGIRAVAFLMVFFSHTSLIPYLSGPFGVTIFFFLSGYLITTHLRREYAQTNTIHLPQFYLRRSLRILPPFYITLGVVVAAAYYGWIPGPFYVEPVVAQSLFLGNYYPHFDRTPQALIPGTQVFWSLAVEEHFYLLFPFVAMIILRRARPKMQVLILGLACLGFLGWRCLLVFHYGLVTERVALGSDTRIDSMLFGCILALGLNPALDPPVRLRPWMAVGLCVLSAGMIAFSVLYRDPRFRETFRYTIQGLALLPLFYVAIDQSRSPWFHWLEWGWVRFIGRLSYSLYLIHFCALKMFGHVLPTLPEIGRCTLALGFSLIYAYAMFLLVERPIARLRKTLHVKARLPKATFSVGEMAL